MGIVGDEVEISAGGTSRVADKSNALLVIICGS